MKRNVTNIWHLSWCTCDKNNLPRTMTLYGYIFCTSLYIGLKLNRRRHHHHHNSLELLTWTPSTWISTVRASTSTSTAMLCASTSAKHSTVSHASSHTCSLIACKYVSMYVYEGRPRIYKSWAAS